MRALGTRSVSAVVLLGGAVAAMWQSGLFRSDYWAQLSPWVAFLAAGFAVLAATLVVGYWRLEERSEYYLRFGEKLPFGAETALGPSRGTTLLVGHAAQVRVLDFPPGFQRLIYIAVFLGICLCTLDNRAVALLRDVPDAFGGKRSDVCKEPEPPKVDEATRPGCKLVERAYKLGYAKSLGSCAPKAAETEDKKEVCRLRQLDEPYLHWAYRLLDKHVTTLQDDPGELGMIERLEQTLDHLEAIYHATLDSIAMESRSSHHVFTNLPDPRASFGDQVRGLFEHGCGARLAHLAHFPVMEPGPNGPSLLFEHVLAQLLFNPLYRPVVAQCQEVFIHWDAPADACTRLAADPTGFLETQDLLDPLLGMVERRRRRIELAQLETPPPDVAPAPRVLSLQCMIFDPAATPGVPVEHGVVLDGEPLVAREVRMPELTADGSSQILLYKQAAGLLTEGFGYGRLTSNQAIGARPEEATMAETFREPAFLLTKLDLLHDADLFLGNDWLAKRPDLLEVYPYHLHLENFVEIFRRQYIQHRGRL